MDIPALCRGGACKVHVLSGGCLRKVAASTVIVTAANMQHSQRAPSLVLTDNDIPVFHRLAFSRRSAQGNHNSYGSGNMLCWLAQRVRPETYPFPRWWIEAF